MAAAIAGVNFVEAFSVKAEYERQRLHKDDKSSKTDIDDKSVHFNRLFKDKDIWQFCFSFLNSFCTTPKTSFSSS